MKSIAKIINFVKTEKALKSFIIRAVIFLSLYSIIFANHRHLTNLLYGYGYRLHEPYLIYLIYPFLGLFFILRLQKIKEFGSYKNNWIHCLGFLILSAIFFLISLRGMYLRFPNFPHDFIYFSTALPGFMALFFAIFGFKFIKHFSSDFFILVYFFILYLTGEILIEKFWIYLSGIILYALNFILPLFSKTVFIDPSQLNVTVNDFQVSIGATCSGIYSLITFTFLFVVSVLFLKEKNKINYFKASAALIFGLIFIFILNILRVATITLVGAFYSPELAIELFHEYMSAILLIGLFLGYLYFIFPRIVKQKA